jgi:hypothetical protein
MPRITLYGDAWPQILDIPDGDGITVLPIFNAGVLVGTAQQLNFIGAGVSVDGVNPNQLNINVNGPLALSAGEQLYIYYDDLGNDTTGDGTIGNPYLTLQRALYKYPAYYVTNGSAVIWLPVNPSSQTATAVITLPPMLSDGSICQATTPITGFQILRNFNIMAPLQDLFNGSPIAPSDIATTTVQDKTQRITLWLQNNPNLPLTPNALIGQFIIDASGSPASITGNDEHTIEVNMDYREIDLTQDIQVYGCGATVHRADTGDVIQIGSQVQNLQVGGMEFTNDNTNSYPHQGVVGIFGAQNVTFQTCHMQGMNSRAANFLSLYACNIGKAGAASNITVDGQQITFYRCHCRAAFDQFNFFGYYHISGSALGCDRMGSTQGVGSVGSFQISRMYIEGAPAASMAIYISDQCFLYQNYVVNGSYGILGLAPGGFCDIRDCFMTGAAYADVAAQNGTFYSIDGPQGTVGVSADKQQFIDPVTSLTATPQGTPGVSTNRYMVISISTNGSKTKCDTIACSTSNLVLDNVNFNRITWVDGLDINIDHYEVWREYPSIEDPGLIGTVAVGAQTLDDTGQVPTATQPIEHDLISWTDFATMGMDTDLAPYSGGVVRSRIVAQATP